jgi:uncharacterized protein
VVVSARKGDWMQTASGRQFWPLDPCPEDVCVIDIAHALSNICRFGGHCSVHYSVAQHAVLVSLEAERATMSLGFGAVEAHRSAIVGLHHEDAEAYIGDMVRPLKRLMLNFCELEELIVQRAIGPRFGFKASAIKSTVIKQADEILLATEARDLMGGQSAGKWCLRAEPLPERIVPVSHAEAKAMFLARHRELGGAT